MFAKLKAALAGLTGGSGARDDPPAETIEYKGYRIKPAPYPTGGGAYQTAAATLSESSYRVLFASLAASVAEQAGARSG